MSTTQSLETETYTRGHRFLERNKLLSDRDEIKRTAQTAQKLLSSGEADALKAFLGEKYPADLADVMYFLNDDQDKALFQLLDTREAAEVLDEVDECTREVLVQATTPEQLAKILNELPADESTDILQAAKPEQIERVLSLTDRSHADQIRTLLSYPKESAGGVMSPAFVAVLETATVGDALQALVQAVDAEPIPYIYVVDIHGGLMGFMHLHQLLSADSARRVSNSMMRNYPSVPVDLDQEQVARIFARYDLMALPVVERKTNKLLGVITADDVIDVLEAETTEDQMRMAGSDAEELEKRSPTRIAVLRLPWIMATMFIELFAGLVIHFFDATLAHIILLASFMPIISAISGNTGLQSATIIVRGLSAGQIRVLDWQRALSRQLKTTLILGAATGLVLGAIGAISYGKPTFGLVVAIGMFSSVNIAGIVGTIVPLTSKRLGFDPAITSGPFETAFQDVVGISIFLGLATFLSKYLL